MAAMRKLLLPVVLPLFLLTLLFLAAALWPPVGMALGGADVRGLFVPWLELTRTAVWQGHLPFWHAAQFAGYPFLSNPQVALFYPPTWLAILLPVRVGLSWHVLFHVLAAGLGMWLFVRQQTGSRVGAWLSALTFAGCVPAILGVKRYQSGTTTIDFITGADITVGANGIDTVENNRGIKPKYDFTKPEMAR